MQKYLVKLTIFLFSTFLVSFVLYTSYAFPKIKEKKPYILKTYTTIRPNYGPGKHHLVKLQLSIIDDTESNKNILDVEFNNKKIPLNPIDPSGKRANIYMQLKPGTYLVKWKISEKKYSYPRHHTYREKIILKENDDWVHILIEGKQLTISR